MSLLAAVSTAARAAGALAAGALFCAAASGQVRPIDPLERNAAKQAHLQTFLGERALHFLERYAAADEDARRKALVEFEKARTPGTAVNAPVSLAGLIRGARALDGVLEGEAERLQRYMDGLDILVVPGVFESREDETQRPDALTLQVHAMLPTTGGTPEWISAWWIAPDGSEVRARRESVDPALVSQPFELYVHAPNGPPGIWRLVLQGERDGKIARGIPLQVEGVRAWRERLSNVLARDDLVDGWAFMASALTRLQALGTRSALTPSAGAMLEALEQRDVPRGTSHPLRAVFLDSAEREHWLWTLVGADLPEKPTTVVVLLAPLAESPEFVLAGEHGRRWHAFASDQKALLYSTHLPAAASESTDLLAPIDKVRALHPDARLVVVARGDTWGRLALALKARQEKPPMDALVVQAALAAAAPKDLNVPWLLVAPGGAAAPEGGAREWIDGEATALLGEALLPERILAWLRAREGRGDK